MILLPRGNPVKEKIDPGRINLPDALQKLHDGNFSGYLRFETGAGVGIVIFERGRLISALFEGDGQLTDGVALARIFELALLGNTTLDIYRLSPELALSIQALLHGEMLYRGQELKLIDIKALLGRFREERLSGCLRIYTAEHVALIFYRDGSPLGFFHDGSTDIETTADASMSVARQPGAKLDVLSSRLGEGADLADLLATADLATVWKRAQEAVGARRRQEQAEASRGQELREQERRQKLQGQLRTIAERAVGKIGASLLDKEFDRALPPGSPLTEAACLPLFEGVARGAKLVAGPSKIEQMVDEMKKAVRGLS